LKNEVTVAFNKFDADGSNGIDKEELAELSKELG
jgi:Ca2+-binding EF-hand superfamily protein